MTNDSVPITMSTDFIEVTTDKFSSQIPTFTVRHPKIGEEILLVGYYKYASNLNSQLSEVLRFGKSGPCRVSVLDKGCIYYGCQTHQGFSGAPLIHLGPNSIDIIGIHLSTVSDQVECPTVPTDGNGNLGYVLNTKNGRM